MRGATCVCLGCLRGGRYFNPRSSCEERPMLRSASPVLVVFQSTLLMRGATKYGDQAGGGSPFQSTLLMRGATASRHEARILEHISIHAPHARSDPPARGAEKGARCISIHAPHARSDRVATLAEVELIEFQSTLLMRGATRHGRPTSTRWPNFNPRSSCEERRLEPASNAVCHNFNPRSSCEERPQLTETQALRPEFQSTLLMRGATRGRR